MIVAGVLSSLSMPPIWIFGPPMPPVLMLMVPGRGSGSGDRQADKAKPVRKSKTWRE